MTAATDRIFKVLPRQLDKTVAAALREWLPGQSWSQIQQLFKSRRVMVSGNLCMDAGRRLRLVDVVKVLVAPLPPPPKEDAIRIRYLDKDLVVVEKPAGLTTTRHAEERDWPARRRQLQPTLDELLPRVIARKEGRRKGLPPPVRAVHRLDRETSGLMVFARTAKAEQILAEQFRRHTTHRRYLAIALGSVEAQTIESRLVRDRGDRRRGSSKDANANVGRRAVTHVQPLESLGDYTLVECSLETGRTHQIRIHLSENGHPLCGEKIYRQALFGQPKPDHSGAPRVALHAAELGFVHPSSGESMKFEAPLPEDLRGFLNRLRRAARAKGKG